jgi:transcriptional regulator with XRE-family HTH domain
MGALRDVRKACGFSQRALAEATQLRLETVYHIERGNRQPRLAVMRLICDALKVEPQSIDEFRSSIAQEDTPRLRERQR